MESSSQHPETARPDSERRAGEDRRAGDRRASGRRNEDRARQRASMVIATVWAIAGAIVVLYLFFIAIGAIDPADARVPTIIVLVLAVLWVAHAWRRLYAGGYISRTDRERRGF